jgi:hypothetical protein
MAGVAQVGITKIDGMIECWESGIMGDRVILPIFKFSIPKLLCAMRFACLPQAGAMRYLFSEKEATL